MIQEELINALYHETRTGKELMSRNKIEFKMRWLGKNPTRKQLERLLRKSPKNPKRSLESKRSDLIKAEKTGRKRK